MPSNATRGGAITTLTAGPKSCATSTTRSTTAAGLNSCATSATTRTTVAITTMLVVLIAYIGVAQSRATATLTSPRQQFGHDIGDDYFLANYTQYAEYLLKLDKESDRMTVV